MMDYNLVKEGKALPTRIPFQFFAIGFISLIAFVAIAFSNLDGFETFFKNGRLIALTHAMTLGFISMVIMGALYQLLPVMADVKIASKAIADLHFLLFLSGISLFIYGSATGAHGLYRVSGYLLAAGAFVFVANIIISVILEKRWNVTVAYVFAALIFFVAITTIGVLLIIDRDAGLFSDNGLAAVRLHLVVAVAGFVGLTIVIASYKLISMFYLSKMRDDKRTLVLIASGVAVSLVSIVLPASITEVVFILGLIIVGAGFASYLAEIKVVLGGRLRKTLDLNLLYFVAALSYLAVVGGSLILLAAVHPFSHVQIPPHVMTALTFALIVGFPGQLTIGMLHKIFPFLVWHHKYSKFIGVKKVPLLKDMFSERLAYVGFWLFTAGLVITIAGLFVLAVPVIAAGFVLIGLSVAIFIYNMIVVVIK